MRIKRRNAHVSNNQPAIATCGWQNVNYRLITETKADLSPTASFPTLPCHEGTDADACALVGNTRQIAWTWRGQGHCRRQPS